MSTEAGATHDRCPCCQDLAAQGKADQQALADDKAAMSAQLRKWTKGNATQAKAEQVSNAP